MILTERKPRRPFLTEIVLGLLLLVATVTVTACNGGADAAEDSAHLVQREAGVAAREQQVQQRETSATEREKQLDTREAALTEQEKKLADEQKQLEASDQQLDRRAAKLASRESSATALERQLAARQDALANERAKVDRESDRLAAEREADQRREEERARPAPQVEARIDQGTPLDVEFLSTVSSASSRPGETFRARVLHDLYSRDGILAVPQGSELVGEVAEAVPLKKVGGQARLALQFKQVVLPSGQRAPISASFYEEGRNESKRDGAKIGGAAAGGALLGRLLDKNNKGRGTILGAIIGAAAGTAAAAGSGDEVEIPSGAQLTLRLDRPLVITLAWTPQSPEP